MTWLSLFSELGSVRISTWDFECEVVVRESFDETVSYSHDNEGYKLLVPRVVIYDDVAIEICVLWLYCMENPDLTGCSVILFCNRKMLWLALKKRRYKELWVNLILRHVDDVA